MPPPTTESDNYKLLFAVLDQLEVKGVNWAKVAEQLGVEKVGTVQKRWSVLKKREGLGQGATTTETPTTIPKKRAGGANGKSGNPAKKAKTVKKKTKAKAEESEVDAEEGDGDGEGEGEDEDGDEGDY